MRLLICLFSPATGTLGGLTRGLAIANAAKDAGHDVAFAASGAVERDLRRRGHRVYSVPSPTMFGLPPALSRRIERRMTRARLPIRPGRSFGSIWTVLLVSGYARAAFLERLVGAERRAATEFGADGLFTDLDPGAYLLATIENLPIASAFQSVMTSGVGSLPWRLIARATSLVIRDAARVARPPQEIFWGPDVLKLVPSIPPLDGGGDARPDLRYVGYLAAAEGTNKAGGFMPESGVRYVFVYVGTGSLPLPFLERVLPEVFPDGGSLRCVVGGVSTAEPYRRGGVEFHSFVSAASLLPYSDWTICHGGLNTVIDSLRAGVPILAFPGPIFERRFNAERLANSGAGLFAEVTQFEPAWLASAITRHDEFVASARRLGTAIDAGGGAKATMAAIEDWTRIRGADAAQIDMGCSDPQRLGQVPLVWFLTRAC